MSNNIINKDKKWLKNEVEKAIVAFIDSERDYFTDLLTKYVYEQIF